MTSSKAYLYCKESVKRKTTPSYVKKQMRDFMRVCEGKDKKFVVSESKVRQVENILRILRMPKGLKAGQTLYDCTTGSMAVLYRHTLHSVPGKPEQAQIRNRGS